MDPFGLTTGVAGPVSLGLTLCDGITTYCRNYRSRNQDLESPKQHAERLRTFLCLFEHRATGNGAVDARLKTVVQEALETCAICLLDVKSLTSKYPPTRQVKGLRVRTRVVVDRLKYLFQKDELLTFREQLNDLRSDLYGYQLLLNHDLTASVGRALRERSDLISQAIQDQDKRVLQHIAQIVPTLSRTTGSRLETLDKNIQGSLTRLETAILSVSQTQTHPVLSGSPDDVEPSAQDGPVVIHNADNQLGMQH